MTSEQDKQKLLNELIESSKSKKDKLTAARLIAIKDNQKAAAAIKSMMDKK